MESKEKYKIENQHICMPTENTRKDIDYKTIISNEEHEIKMTTEWINDFHGEDTIRINFYEFIDSLEVTLTPSETLILAKHLIDSLEKHYK